MPPYKMLKLEDSATTYNSTKNLFIREEYYLTQQRVIINIELINNWPSTYSKWSYQFVVLFSTRYSNYGPRVHQIGPGNVFIYHGLKEALKGNVRFGPELKFMPRYIVLHLEGGRVRN